MTHCVAVFDAQFTEEKVAREMEYFMRSSEKSYERTYGWAWLLKLQEQLEVVEGGRWAETLRPLASLLVARWAGRITSTAQYNTVQYSTVQVGGVPAQPRVPAPCRHPHQHSIRPRLRTRLHEVARRRASGVRGPHQTQLIHVLSLGQVNTHTTTVHPTFLSCNVETVP